MVVAFVPRRGDALNLKDEEGVHRLYTYSSPHLHEDRRANRCTESHCGDSVGLSHGLAALVGRGGLAANITCMPAPQRRLHPVSSYRE